MDDQILRIRLILVRILWLDSPFTWPILIQPPNLTLNPQNMDILTSLLIYKYLDQAHVCHLTAI
jgi:hypothetical protein